MPSDLLTRIGSTACIRLDRPDRGNALSPETVATIHAALEQSFADASMDTVVFTGAGRNFCTGFDLSDLAECTDAILLDRLVRVELLLDAVWNAPVRTIALGQGRVWGAGADLFAACDHRLATADAQFRFPGAAFGIVLGTRRLTARVGRDYARRLTCEGGMMTAAEALSAGLVTAVVEAEEAWRAIASAPQVARHTAAALRRASGDQASDADLAALVRSAAIPGLQERIVAYRAHSAPKAAKARSEDQDANR